MRRAIDEKWQQPKPLIFQEFIEKNRNAVVKRYEHPETDFDKIMGTLYPRLVVQYQGKVGVLVDYLVEEAIKFWEEYLGDIDRLAHKYGPQ